MREVKITHKIGNVVIVKQKHWKMFTERLSGNSHAIRRRGCEDWCNKMCRSEGGCDFEFGEPGECGALCESGEIFLQIP